MQKSESVIINNVQYNIKQLPGRQSLETFGKLMKLLSSSSGEKQSETLDNILSRIASLDITELLKLVDLLINKTPLVTDSNGKQIDVDSDFSGDNLADLIELIHKVILVNYRNFFLEIGSLIIKLITETLNLFPGLKKAE